MANCPVRAKILYAPGGRLGGDQGGWGASLAFHVGEGVGGSPNDVVAFCLFAGGTAETVTIGGVSTTRIVPLRHPFLPNMVAQRVDAQGTGRPIDGAPGWSDWKVAIDFALMPYAFTGDAPYMTIRRVYGASAITLPGKALRVGGVPLEHDVPAVLNEINYSFTKYNVPETADDSVYRSLSGTVNAGVFRIMGVDCAPETVLFGGVQDEIVQTIAFTTNRTVSLSVAWRPRPWTQVVLPSGVWATPTFPDGVTKIYGLGNYNLLYQ